MDVCLVAYTFYETDNRVRRYAEFLAARGDHVDVLSLRKKDQSREGLLNSVHIYRIQERLYNEKGLLDYIIRIGSFFLKGGYYLTRNYLKNKYDVIHVHNVPDFLVFMSLVPKMLGAKIILDIHDILPEFFSQKFNKDMDSFLCRILLFIERISIGFSDHVIVANDLWRMKLLRRNRIDESRCSTLMNFPELKYFKKSNRSPQKDNVTIIYPGTLSHHHGIDIAIKALSIVKEKFPTVKLKIYGTSNNEKYYSYIKRLINELYLGENVKIYNPVPIGELAIIYSNVDIGIVPKRGGIFAGEAFSTKILDFMAAEVPIVASRTEIDEYYFNDLMIKFFTPESHEEMARCIIDVIENPSSASNMVALGKRYVEINNWEMKNFLYGNIIKSLLSR